MKEAQFVKATYEFSDSVELQGKEKVIEPYIKNGYYVKENRNGYWVLVRPCRVIVRIMGDGKVKDFNMKEDICSLYGKQKISKKTFHKFSDDADSGKIKFQIGDEGYSIKKA